MKRFSIILVFISLMVSAFSNDFGAAGASEKSSFTIEEMLEYAIQDEYLALNEYEAIVKKFGPERPYTNIIESEKTHIKYLEEIYKDYNIKIPKVSTAGHIVIPSSLLEAAKTGVEAEINNIAMYNKFLSQDLPDDIREVFTFLRDASKNHLSAFQRQVDSGSNGGRNNRN